MPAAMYRSQPTTSFHTCISAHSLCGLADKSSHKGCPYRSTSGLIFFVGKCACRCISVLIFTTRRYASAVHAVVMLSVCLLQVLIFFTLGFRMLIHTLKTGFCGYLTTKMGSRTNVTPKGTSLHGNTSYDV